MRALLCVLLVASSSLPALADAAADCNRFDDPARQIKGCTSFIRRGSLQMDMLSMAYTNRGIAEGNLGRIAKAIADFDEAIRLDPKSPLAFYNRGNARMEKHQLDQALSDFSAAIANDPEFALAFYNRGVVLELKGDRAACIADYQKALDLDPGIEPARERLQVLGARPGRPGAPASRRPTGDGSAS